MVDHGSKNQLGILALIAKYRGNMDVDAKWASLEAHRSAEKGITAGILHGWPF